VKELKAADLLGNGQSGDAEKLAVLDGQKAELERNIALAKDKARAGGGKVASILELLEEWDNELKAVLKEREEVAGRLASRDGDAVGGTQAVARQLRAAREAVRLAEGEAQKQAARGGYEELRGRVKVAVRRLVESVWVAAWEVDASTKAAE